jgi:hypothetical protein
MATVADVQRIANGLPRTDEVIVRDRLKFRIGPIVYASFSRDETRLGFAYPKDARAALVAAEPELFLMPEPSDERYNWVQLYLDAVDVERLREILLDAWLMVVGKRVAAEYLASLSASSRSATPDRPPSSAG